MIPLINRKAAIFKAGTVNYNNNSGFDIFEKGNYLLYVHKGNEIIILKEAQIKIHQGSFIILPSAPFKLQRFNSESILINFVTPLCLYNLHSGLFEAESRLIEILMKLKFKLLFNASSESTEDLNEVREYLQDFSLKLESQSNKIPAEKKSTRLDIQAKLERVKRHIDENYKTDLKLKKLCEAAGISEYHFLRLFKSYFGITPHQYILNKRLNEASERIRLTEDTVTDVCYDMGFSSLSTFSGMFKRKFGITPKEMKKSYSRFKTRLMLLKQK